MKRYIIPSIGLLILLASCDVKQQNIDRHFKSDISSIDTSRVSGLIKTKYVCPDCGEWGCIYEDIDSRYDQGTDIDIEQAIQSVCKERGIIDPKTIDLLRANYYL